MGEYPPDPGRGIRDEVFVGNDQQTVPENRLPLAQQFVLEPKVQGDVGQVVAPRHVALEESAEARPGTIERVAPEPDQRCPGQQRGGEPDEARRRERLVDDTPGLGEALVHPVAQKVRGFRRALEALA